MLGLNEELAAKVAEKRHSLSMVRQLEAQGVSVMNGCEDTPMNGVIVGLVCGGIGLLLAFGLAALLLCVVVALPFYPFFVWAAYQDYGWAELRREIRDRHFARGGTREDIMWLDKLDDDEITGDCPTSKTSAGDPSCAKASGGDPSCAKASAGEWDGFGKWPDASVSSPSCAKATAGKAGDAKGDASVSPSGDTKGKEAADEN